MATRRPTTAPGLPEVGVHQELLISRQTQRPKCFPVPFAVQSKSFGMPRSAWALARPHSLHLFLLWISEIMRCQWLVRWLSKASLHRSTWRSSEKGMSCLRLQWMRFADPGM